MTTGATPLGLSSPERDIAIHTNLRRTLSTLLASVVLASGIIVAGASTAAAYTGGCSQTIGTGTLYVKLFEGINYEYGGTAAALCIRASGTGSTNVPDLNNVAYQSEGDHICDGQLIQDYGNWNDCASSIQSQFSDCHHTITVYSGINYTNGYTRTGLPALDPSWTATQNIPNMNNLNWSPSASDSISSLKVTYHAVCQSAPVQ